MRTTLTLFKLFLLVICIKVPHLVALNRSEIDDTHIDREGRPTQALLELLSAQSVAHNGTFASIVNATQKLWVKQIRPASTLRSHIPPSIIARFECDRQRLIPLFNNLGMISKLSPSYQSYDYVLIFGAFGPEIKKRLEYLQYLLAQGLQTHKIVLLTGEREVDPADEKEALAAQLPKETILDNETDIACAHYFLTFSTSTNMPIELVVTPKKHGKVPNTEHQIINWLETRPQPGRVLGISHQPYCERQKSAIIKHLPVSFKVDIAGPAADASTPVALLLDTLGRSLYLKQQIHKWYHSKL